MSGIQVIARAAEILRVLHESPDGATLADLARRVDLPRSTVHRIAAALEAEGLLGAGRVNGRLELGPELARLASTSPSKLLRVARPSMERLAREVGETVDLAVLQDMQVRFVDQVVGSRRLRAASVVGALYPAHCTANGKVLLSALPTSTIINQIPVRLPKHTENTLKTRTELLDELRIVRDTGIGFDREEHELLICAVAVPLHDTRGVLAALTVAAPSERFYAREDELAAAVRERASDIDEALIRT